MTGMQYKVGKTLCKHYQSDQCSMTIYVLRAAVSKGQGTGQRLASGDCTVATF